MKAGTTVDIKVFQKRYALANKDMANICQCSLPTVQKWRSGEVGVSGSAQQLMRLLDAAAEGDPVALRSWLTRMKQPISGGGREPAGELQELETSMTKVVDRLQLMLEGRRKDRELAESEARYRSMLESQTNPVCRWLPDTTLTYVNEAYQRLYGSPGESILGRKWLDFVPEERRSDIAILVSDIVRRGVPDSMVHESLDSEGRLVIMEWRDIPVKDERGNLVELHSVGCDLTELVQLRRANAELEKLRSTLFAVCENAVLVFDEDGRFLDMNDRFRALLPAGTDCSSMAGMVSGFPQVRFRQLLKRIDEGDQMLYRLKTHSGVQLMNVRLLGRGPAGDRYVGLLSAEGGQAEPVKPLLQVRLAAEGILSGQSGELKLSPDVRATVEREMERIGQQTAVHRFFVFTFDSGLNLFDNVLEWCAEGVTPQIDDLQRMPMENFPWWVNRLRNGQWIQIEDTARMPRQASMERDILVAQGIRAVLAAPLAAGDQVVGFAGFDQVDAPRLWHEQEKEALGGFKERIQSILALP